MFGGAAATGFSVGVAITAKDMYSRAFAKAQTDLRKLRQVSETEAARLEKSLRIGQTMTKVGATITAASFMIDRALQGSVETAAEFSQKIANVSTLLESKGVTATEEFKKGLEENIFKASKVAGKSIMEVGDASYALVSGVADANEALAAVPEAAKLARAAMGSTDSAVEVMTNTLNTYAKSWDMSGQEKAVRISDMYSKTVALAKTDLDKMTDSMQYAGAAGLQYGQNMETVLASVGTLQSAGLAASMAGTSFRMMLTQVSKNRDKLEALGVQVKDSQGNFLDLRDILAQLKDKLQGMTEVEVAAFIEDTFGVRGAAAAKLLIENFEGFDNMLNQIRDSAGSTGEMLEKAMEGGQAQTEALRAETEKLKAQMAEKLMPVQLKIKKGFMEIGSAVLDSPITGEVAKWGVAIVGLGAKVGKILGPTMTLVGMLTQMRAMKKITLALENKGVVQSAGRGMAGAFGTALAGAAIAVGVIKVAQIIIAKKREEEKEAGLAAISRVGAARTPEEEAAQVAQLKELARAKGGAFAVGGLSAFQAGTVEGKAAREKAKELAKASGLVGKELVGMQGILETAIFALEKKKNADLRMAKTPEKALEIQAAYEQEMQGLTGDISSLRRAVGEFDTGLVAAGAELIKGGPTKGPTVGFGAPTAPTIGFQSGAWEIPATQQAIIHKKEMILPPRVAERVRSGTAAVGAVPTGGGNLTVNFNGVNPNDPDAIAKAINIAFKRMVKGMPV